MHELRGQAEPDLETQLARLSPCDLVLVEGYKRAPIPKLEVHRPSLGRPLLADGDPDIVAVATDAPVGAAVPVLPLADYDAIVAFVEARLGLAGRGRPAPRR
jgi:molybdopterin-guanine dinucleotide biosynthesis protein B